MQHSNLYMYPYIKLANWSTGTPIQKGQAKTQLRVISVNFEKNPYDNKKIF